MSPEAVRNWISACGGRRFIMCMGAHFVNTLLLIFGFLDQSGYLTAFGGTIVVYVGASGVQKYTETRSQ